MATLVVLQVCHQWRNAHWVGLVQKLRPPTVRGPHQPRPIARKIRKRKNAGV
jgi:hypothetical protein